MQHKKIEAIKYSGRLPTLCVFRCNDEPLFAAREIAEHLGYVQHGSLRKQTLTAWELSFVHMQDYHLYTTAMALHPYKWLYDRVRKEPLREVKLERGRLFYTVAGLLKVFDRTTKNPKDLLEALKSQGIITARDLTKHATPKAPKPSPVKPVMKRATPVTPIAPVKPPVQEVSKPKPKPLDERRFEYEALQKLLRQLERLDDPALRNLAVMAAESALGKKLPNVWTPLPTQQDVVSMPAGEPLIVRGTAAPLPIKVTGGSTGDPVPQFSTTTSGGSVPSTNRTGPYFTLNEYYSLSRIGEKAGGYTSVTAGKAADIVGSKIGYSRDDLRTKNLPVNQIKMRPDNTSGKERPMVRFNLKFSNAVVLELRKNATFQPAKVKIPDGVVSVV